MHIVLFTTLWESNDFIVVTDILATDKHQAFSTHRTDSAVWMVSLNHMAQFVSYWSRYRLYHYSDVITTTVASQMNSLTVVYSIVYSEADQRKHQSSASLVFVRGIHRWPVNSPHREPGTRNMFPFDDVIMIIGRLGSRQPDYFVIIGGLHTIITFTAGFKLRPSWPAAITRMKLLGNNYTSNHIKTTTIWFPRWLHKWALRVYNLLPGSIIKVKHLKQILIVNLHSWRT